MENVSLFTVLLKKVTVLFTKRTENTLKVAYQF